MSEVTKELAIKILSTRDRYGCLCGWTSGYTEALDMAIEALKVDIVYCKECKYRDEFGCHNPVWGDGHANYPAPNTSDYDFCSYGKRR